MHTHIYILPSYPINLFFSLVVKEWSMRTHECQGEFEVIFTHELATTESWL